MANCTKDCLKKLLKLVILPKNRRWHSSARGRFVKWQNAQKNDSTFSEVESLYNYSNWCILEFLREAESI
mgnify:CR=1 FL=1